MDQNTAYLEAVNLLKRMISIPSVSREECAVADLLENYLQEVSGVEVHRSGNNVWVIAPGFDEKKPTLLLNSHCDTVKPVATWTRDPFSPTIEESSPFSPLPSPLLYGLGSNDAGASLVSLLHTFLLLKDTQQAFNLIFLASCEEEVSGKNGIESVLPKLPKIDLAIVGEPTGMHAAIAEKGLVVMDGVAHGKSGHAARNEGINAIYLALEAIQKLKDFRFEKESPTLGPVKISVTQISGGTAHNVVPDECRFVVDVRTTDAYSNEEIVKTLQKLVAINNSPLPSPLASPFEKSSLELTPRSVRLQSSGISESHPLVKRIKSLGRNTFGSPTLSDQCLLPCTSIKIGPGDSARSHTADEYIRLNEIREAIPLYFNMLNNLKLGIFNNEIRGNHETYSVDSVPFVDKKNINN